MAKDTESQLSIDMANNSIHGIENCCASSTLPATYTELKGHRIHSTNQLSPLLRDASRRMHPWMIRNAESWVNAKVRSLQNLS